MFGLIWLFILTFIKGFTCDSPPNILYSIIGQNAVRLHRPYQFTIQLEQTPPHFPDIQIKAFLSILRKEVEETRPDYEFLLLDDVLVPGVAKVSESTKPPNEDKYAILAQENFILTPMSRSISISMWVSKDEVGDIDLASNKIYLVVSGTGGLNFTEMSGPLFYDDKYQSLFFQMDKTMYHTGETMRFRLLSLDPSMKPFQGTKLSIFIKDSRKLNVKQWKGVNFDRGLFFAELPIASHPNLGTWWIEIKSDIFDFKRPFSVDQFRLPKVNVELILPKFITFDNKSIEVHVKATHISGEPINGVVILSAGILLARETAVLNFDGMFAPDLYWYSKPEIHLDKHGRGSAVFSIKDEIELQIDEWEPQKNIHFKATVIETLSRKIHETSKILTAHRFPYSMIALRKDKFYQPGMIYELVILLSDHEGIPIEDDNPIAVRVTHWFTNDTNTDTTDYYPVGPHGVINMTFGPSAKPAIKDPIEIQYKDLIISLYCGASETDSSSFLRIVHTGTWLTPKGQKKFGIDIKASKPFTGLRYMVTSGGDILLSHQDNFENATIKFATDLTLPNGTGPTGHLLVYALLPDGYFAADQVPLDLDGGLENYLDLSTSKDVFEPGKNISLFLKAKGKSLIALRSIDEPSMTLNQRSTYDISQNVVDKEFESYAIRYSMEEGVWSSNSAASFDEAELFLLTNGIFKMKPKFDSDHYGGTIAARKAIFEVAIPRDIETSTFRKSSWLWAHVNMDESENGTIEILEPKESTNTWIVSGFSINEKHGLGVLKKPILLKTSHLFTISATIPQNMVFGENLTFKILLFNKHDEDLATNISLILSKEDFSIHGPKSFEIIADRNEVSILQFSISALSVGSKNISLSIKNAKLNEVKIIPTNVNPPGEKIKHMKSMILDLRDYKRSRHNLTLELEDVVQDSVSISVLVIGDILGSSLNNIERINVVSQGCGIHHIVNFVRNLILIGYLKGTAQETKSSHIISTGVKVMEQEYQNFLPYYLQGNGSFTFSALVKQGSTWLTAVVARILIKGQSLVAIDETIIQQSVLFITKMQRLPGFFIENGSKRSPLTRQGGRTLNDVQLTAFCLLALIEYMHSSHNKISSPFINGKQSIQQGLEFLTSAMNTTEDFNTLGVMSFIFHMTGSSSKETSFHKLEKMWDSHYRRLFFHEEGVTGDNKVSIIEGVSYMLVVRLMRNDKLPDSIPILSTLLTEVNNNWDFISNMDTLTALTTLGKYAGKFFAEELDMTLRIRTANGELPPIQMKRETSSITHKFDLPPSTRWISFQGVGRGTSLLQLTWSYNTIANTTTVINPVVEVTASEMKASGFILQVCYLAIEDTLIYLEINLPTGFIFDDDEIPLLMRQSRDIKCFFLDNKYPNNKLLIYTKTMSEGKRTCLNFNALKSNTVKNIAQSYVTLYNFFYDTRDRAFYQVPE